MEDRILQQGIATLVGEGASLRLATVSQMIYVSGDHFAVSTTSAVVRYCLQHDLDVSNIGAQSAESPALLVDLIPEFVRKLQHDRASSGVLVCGTGAGVEIGANRFSGIRASLATDPRIASWAREYDNANVLCLSGWLTGDSVAPILDAWFSAEFKGDARLNQQLATFDSWSQAPD